MPEPWVELSGDYFFGLLFFAPLLGVAVGAVSGAIAGHFAHYGVSKDFLKQIEDSVTLGTSALAILGTNVTVDKVVLALSTLHPKVIRSSYPLSKRQNSTKPLAHTQSNQ